MWLSFTWTSLAAARMFQLALLSGAAIAGLIVLAPLAAEEPGAKPPIKELEKLPVLPKTWDAAAGKPIEIRSAEDAAPYFAADDIAKLTKQVDLKKQFILVFAWRGSGQDKQTFTVAESAPEQIFFTRERGRTKDLREHVKIYALRKNVKWSTK